MATLPKKIIVSGVPGSNSSKLAMYIAKILGYKYLHIGDAIRELASKTGFAGNGEKFVEFTQRFAHDETLNDYIYDFLKNYDQNIVIDSKYLGFIEKMDENAGNNGIFTIYKLSKGNENLDTDTDIINIKEADMLRFKEIYGNDISNLDYVKESHNLIIEQKDTDIKKIAGDIVNTKFGMNLSSEELKTRMGDYNSSELLAKLVRNDQVIDLNLFSSNMFTPESVVKDSVKVMAGAAVVGEAINVTKKIIDDKLEEKLGAETVEVKVKSMDKVSNVKVEAEKVKTKITVQAPSTKNIRTDTTSKEEVSGWMKWIWLLLPLLCCFLTYLFLLQGKAFNIVGSNINFPSLFGVSSTTTSISSISNTTTATNQATESKSNTTTSDLTNTTSLVTTTSSVATSNSTTTIKSSITTSATASALNLNIYYLDPTKLNSATPLSTVSRQVTDSDLVNYVMSQIVNGPKGTDAGVVGSFGEGRIAKFVGGSVCVSGGNYEITKESDGTWFVNFCREISITDANKKILLDQLTKNLKQVSTVKKIDVCINNHRESLF